MTATALRRKILELDPCFYAPLDGAPTGQDLDLASRTALTVANASFVEARSPDGGRARGIYGTTNYLYGGTAAQLDRPSVTDELTMLCFARYPAGSAPSGQNNIFQRPWSSHSSPYYQYGIFSYSAGAFAYASINGNFQTLVGNHAFASGDSWTSGRWHFLAYQWSSRLGTARGMANGAQIENATYTPGLQLAAANTPLYIGRLANANESFGGYVAHVAVFDSFLSRRDLREIEALGKRSLSTISTRRRGDRLRARAV